MLLPFVARDSQAMVIWLIFVILWLLWWVIDVISQMVHLWKVALGIVMITIGLLANALILVIAAWVIYWTKVRE